MAMACRPLKGEAAFGKAPTAAVIDHGYNAARDDIYQLQRGDFLCKFPGGLRRRSGRHLDEQARMVLPAWRQMGST